MGDKENLLAELTREDHTGLLPQIHEALLACGLKYKGPKNSRTLLYYVRDRARKEVGLAALRVGSGPIFSLPKTYWVPRYQVVNAGLNGLPSSAIIESEPGVSSSQFSMRQIAISTATAAHIEQFIRGVVATHAREVAGVATTRSTRTLRNKAAQRRLPRLCPAGTDAMEGGQPAVNPA